MTIPLIFDPNLLRTKRNIAAKNFNSFNFLHKYVAEGLIDRLDFTIRDFKKPLDFGVNGGEICQLLNNSDNLIQASSVIEILKAVQGNKVVIDEELIPFKNESFDLIISNLLLQNLNDIPGCLVQLKNCLEKGGVFIASLMGGKTLFELREVLVKTELELGIGSSPHVFPFADVKDMGGLMQRAGFSFPVADSEIITVSYPNIFKLIYDLRGMGTSNVLLQRSKKYLGKRFFHLANEIYLENYGNHHDEMTASFEVITVTGIKI